MPGRLSLLGAVFIASCTLTSSLDELSGGDAGGGAGGTGGGGGNGGSGGGFPDASSGAAGGVGGGSGGSAGASGQGGSAGTSSLDPPWWDTGFSHRARIFVQNQAGLPLAGSFEVGFGIDPVATFGAGKTTFAIARYSPSAQSWSAHPTYYESVAGKIWIWTPLPASLNPNDIDSSLFLHAGKPGATADDPATVFLFWDGFDGDLDNWHTQNSPSTAAGELVLPAYASIRSEVQWAPGHAVDFALEVDVEVSGQYDWISGGFQRAVDFDNVEPWVIWVNRTAGTIQPEVDISSINAQEVGAAQPIPVSERRIYGVERFPTRSVYRRDNEIEESLGWNTAYTSSMQIRFTTQSASAQSRFDFVRLRRASDPPPAVTLGATESVP